VNEVPQGEQILFAQWSFPDSIWSMGTDGSNPVEVFHTYRIWSMGVARGGNKLAFACGDPNQLAHYCLNIGDAIQHTWMYDFATQQVELLAGDAINDECHTFTQDDSSIYVCRRYDFQPDGSNHSYRLGRIDLPSKDFAWVTDPASPMQMDLHPQPTDDGSALWFTRIDVEGTDQTRSIQRMTLPAGTPALVRNDANEVVLSPDGTRYLYADWAQAYRVYASDLDGQNAVLVADRQGYNLRYSPDGTRVAFLVEDNGCTNIDVVAADGSEANAPTRIRDCSLTGEFITDLAWIVRP
jgi:Tol biopolymer transport system component